MRTPWKRSRCGIGIDHGVAELALLADHRARGDGLGREALRLRLSGGRRHALGRDEVEMAAHVPAPARDEHALRGAGQLERRTEKDLAHAVDVSLAALRAVHAVHAVAQRRVPAALGGVQALQPSARASSRLRSLRKRSRSRTSARSRARETSRTSRSACACRVRSSSSARTAASARPIARRQPTSATAMSASAPKIRIAESRSRTSTETPATRQITTYAAMAVAAEAAPIQPARLGRCRNARLHGAATLDVARRRRQSWADSFAGRPRNPSPDVSRRLPRAVFPVRTGGRASFRREER